MSEAGGGESERGGLRSVLLEAQVLKPSVTQIAGLLAAFALTALVSGLIIYGVKLFSTQQVADDMLKVGHVLMAIGVPATAGVYLYWRKNRIRLRVLDLGEALAVEIGEELIEGPFRLEHGYTTMHVRGMPMRTLSLLFFVEYEEGEGCALALSETWGAAYGVPEGWPERLLSPGGVPPEHAYDIASGRYLRRIKQILERRRRR